MGSHRYWRVMVDEIGSGDNSAYSEVQMRESIGGSNVCSGGTPISGPLAAGSSAANAFDGVTSTHYISKGYYTFTNDQGVIGWIGYDFGAGNEKDIVEIALTSRYDSFEYNSGTHFSLQYSDDGDIWYTREHFSTTNNWSLGETRVFNTGASPQGAHTYWRVRGREAQSADFIGYAEIIFKESVGGSDLGSGLGAVSTGDSDSGHSASYAFDRSYSTKWANRFAGNACGCQYSAGKEVIETTLRARDDAWYYQAAVKFDIQYSDDGTLWWTKWSHESVPTTWSASSEQTFTYAPESEGTGHRYWRVLGYSNDGWFDSSILAFAEIELRTSIGGADQTGAGTASADSFYNSSFVPANAVDNDTGTAWHSTATTFPHWWAYDFGAGNEKDIVEIAITARSAGYTQSPRDFILQYSDDGIDWTEACYFHTSGWTASETRSFSIANPSGASRYWRAIFYANDGASNPNITALVEIEFLISNVDQTGSGTISADSVYGSYPASNAVDDNNTTFWHSSDGLPHPHWLQYDFGAGNEKSIDAISLTARTGSIEHKQAPSIVKIYISDDGFAWQKLTEFSGLTWTSNEKKTLEFNIAINVDGRLDAVASIDGYFTGTTVVGLLSATGSITGTLEIQEPEIETVLIDPALLSGGASIEGSFIGAYFAKPAHKTPGPWAFTEQPNKYGYQNNPNWIDNKLGCGPLSAQQRESVEERHIPCGHWHKGPVGSSVPGLPWYNWQSCPMAATIVSSKILFATSLHSTPEMVYVCSYDISTGLYEVVYSFESALKLEEPSASFRTVGTTSVLLLMSKRASNYPQYRTLYIVVFENGAFARISTIDISIDEDDHLDIEYQVIGAHSLWIENSQEIHFSISACNGTDWLYYSIYYYKSLDGGVTWTRYTVGSGLDYTNKSCITKIGSTLYLLNRGQLPYLFKSTDGGQTWSMITIATEDGGYHSYKYYSNDLIAFNGDLYWIYQWYDAGVKKLDIARSSDGGVTQNRVATLPTLNPGSALGLFSTQFLVVGDTLYLGVILFNYEVLGTPSFVLLSSQDGVAWTVLGYVTDESEEVPFIGGNLGNLVTMDYSNGVIGGTCYYLTKNISEGIVKAFFTYTPEEGLVIRKTPFYSMMNDPFNLPEGDFQPGITIEQDNLQQPIWPFKEQVSKSTKKNGYWPTT